MASKLSDEKLEKKFMQVSNSQDSIQTLSLWLIYHKSQTKKIVDVWMKSLKKAKVPHRLVLLYVANDVIQTCKRKAAPQFAEAFAEVLAEATLLVRDDKIRPNVERVFTVWEQRSIYTTEFIEGLRNILLNSKVQTMQPKFVAEFKPQKVMDKIRKIKKIELESVTKLSAVSSSKLDCSSSEIINQLKDRTHGHQIVHEYDETVHCLQEYLQILEKEVVERTQLIELLEKGEIFYNAQNGEVKVVANAYRTFAGRVKGLKKKLDDLYPTLPSPIPSPCSDAPSPTPSEEGPIMSPLSDTKEEMKEEKEEMLSKNVSTVTTPEKKRVEIKQEVERKQKLPLIEDAPSPEPSPKPLPIATAPITQPLLLSQGTPTTPITAKPQKAPDGLEDQGSGMMTSWLGALNTNNQTFTKAFSLDSRIPQTGSLESRLSSLMESFPNLPQVFRANYETQVHSAGSTPIRADQTTFNSPAVQATTYIENQSDNGEPGTPVNDENRRDATPVEDEDTRFSVGNTLPLASVMSTLSNEDLHQSLLKSLSHLQQLSASNTPPSITQSQKVNIDEPCSTPVSAACTASLDGYHQDTIPFTKSDYLPLTKPDYHQNTPFMKSNYHQNNPPFTKPDHDQNTPFTKPDTSFNSSLPNIPLYLRTPFNLNDIQNAPSIFSAASKLSFPSLSSEPPSPSEDTSKGDLASPSQIYSYTTNKKDETSGTVSPMQTDQSYNKQVFSTEEENLEPMDMDLDESDEEENDCTTIIEGMPPSSGDVDLRVPSVPQKTEAIPTSSWSSCITSDVTALIPPVSHQDTTVQPVLHVNTSSEQEHSETFVPQHCPVQDMHHFSQNDPQTDQKSFKKDGSDFNQKCYNDEDLRHHKTDIRHQNSESVTSHHMESMGRYNEVRHHSVDDVRHHNTNVNDRIHNDLHDGRIQNTDDGRHHNFSDGRYHSFDDGTHHSTNDEKLHNADKMHFNVDDGKHLGIDERRYHSVGEERFHPIDSGRPCTSDAVSHHNLDDLSHHNVSDTSHHSINDASHHSISDTSHHSVDDTSHHSIDSASHHSGDDARHHIVDDVKHHNASDVRNHNIKDIHQYSFEDVRQQNYVNLTPHTVENVGQYTTELPQPSISERSDSVENQNFQRSTENGGSQSIGVNRSIDDIQSHDVPYREVTESSTAEDTGHKKSPYVEVFSSGVIGDVRQHSMPYAERNVETITTTAAPTTTISTSESSYYPDSYAQSMFQQPVPTQITEQRPVNENRIQTVQSVRQNNSWNENWNEEPWERQVPHGPMRRRGQPYFRPRFPDYQNRYPQEQYQPYGRRNNYRPRFPVPPFNPRYPPPTHLIPGGRGSFPPRY